MYYILYFQIVIPFDSVRMKEGIMYSTTKDTGNHAQEGYMFKLGGL